MGESRLYGSCLKRLRMFPAIFFFTVEFNQREKKKERKGDGVV